VQGILDTASNFRERYGQLPKITLSILYVAMFDEPSELRSSLERLRGSQVSAITGFGSINLQFLETFAAETTAAQPGSTLKAISGPAWLTISLIN